MATEMTGKSITRERFRRERMLRLSSALRGGALFLAGTVCGYVLFGSRNLPGLILEGACLLLAAGGLALSLRALARVPAASSVFGRSVLARGGLKRDLSALCAEIDRDFDGEFRSFGPLSVGREWAVGDEAVPLSLICGIFAVQMSRNTHALLMVDVNGSVHALSMEPDQAEAAAQYLQERLPRAIHGDFDRFQALLDMTPAERRKHGLSLIPEDAWDPAARLAFWGTDGIPTSNFTAQDVAEAFRALEPGKTAGFTLTGTEIPNGAASGLFARLEPDGTYRLAVSYTADGAVRRSVRAAEAQDALEALEDLLKTGKTPDFSRWDPMEEEAEEPLPYQLILDRKIYRHNTAEDVALGLEALTAGSCSSLALMRPDRSSGGLFADKVGERYRVMAAVPSPDGVRWLETVTKRPDQVRFWVESYYGQSVFPYLSGWTDITEQMAWKKDI